MTEQGVNGTGTMPQRKGVSCMQFRSSVLLFCLISASTSIAESSADYSIRQASCSIELSMYQSPTHYLVAVVEHPGEMQCQGTKCVETLSIVRVLGSGVQRESPLGTIRISFGATNGRPKNEPYPKGMRTVGVYVPDANTEFYALLSEAWPVSEVVIWYEQGLKAALAAHTGAPDCRVVTH
jgi:hypothetical protein